MKLSVIVPVYNERDTIGELLARLAAASLGSAPVGARSGGRTAGERPAGPAGAAGVPVEAAEALVPVEREIVVVEDCSTDGTRELLAKVCPPGARVVYHVRNEGKGAAIRTGLAHASGDYVIIQDADLEYDPREIRCLLAAVLAGRATTVYGSRFLGRVHRMTFSQWLGNRLLTVLTNVLYGATLTDMETCYKLMPADVAKSLRLRARRFEFEPEVTAKLLRRGQRILELPISYTARASREGKKISWRDGLPALWALLKYRFVD